MTNINNNECNHNDCLFYNKLMEWNCSKGETSETAEKCLNNNCKYKIIKTNMYNDLSLILGKNIDMGCELGGLISVKKFDNLIKDIINYFTKEY